MTLEQLNEIEARAKAATDDWLDNGVAVDDALTLCTALREAWRERDDLRHEVTELNGGLVMAKNAAERRGMERERAKEDRNRIAMETRREWMEKCKSLEAAKDAEIARLREALNKIFMHPWYAEHAHNTVCELQEMAAEALKKGAE